jgi:hypothetical protein
MTSPAAGAPKTHPVEITVNNKPVAIDGPRVTGLQIKEAATGQGVQIGLDFQLTEVHKDRTRKIIGDTDTVTVHPGSTFVAAAGDDNS